MRHNGNGVAVLVCHGGVRRAGKRVAEGWRVALSWCGAHSGGNAHGRTACGCRYQRERVLVRQDGMRRLEGCRLRPETGRTEASDGNTAFTVSLCSPEGKPRQAFANSGQLDCRTTLRWKEAGQESEASAERAAASSRLRPARIAAAAFQAARCVAREIRDNSRRKTGWREGRSGLESQ